MGDVERENPVGAEMAEVPFPVSHRQQQGKCPEAERQPAPPTEQDTAERGHCGGQHDHRQRQ